ncbi:hypothetical protein AA313_de0201895 [Arthrobotrys entomopaga]|nr:hypothetical protein AA313_de0201895 [Arthrobotrys entomopaga]
MKGQWPTEPDTPTNCIDWIEGFSGDDCVSLASAAGLSDSNPALARDCSGVKDSWGYCKAISGSAPVIPTVSITTTTTAAAAAATTTTTTTTRAPNTTPSPQSFVYQTTQFPPSAGVLQCIAPSSQNPNPVAVWNEWNFPIAVQHACQQLVGSSKFLAVGNAYTTTLVADTRGFVARYALQIKLGGFSVTQDLCIQQLSTLSQCKGTNPSTTYGGCAYTSDGNFQACIFPDGTTGTPAPWLVQTNTTPGNPPPSTSPTSTPALVHDTTQFPPSGGALQCIVPTRQDPNPASVWNAWNFPIAVQHACQQLVGDSGKFLAVGNPYTTSLVADTNGFRAQYALQMKLGGFVVTQDLCVKQLSTLSQCKGSNPSTTYGGCTYTSDGNFEACIFPDGSRGTPASWLVPPPPTQSSPPKPKPYDVSQFPPSGGQLQCITAKTQNNNGITVAGSEYFGRVSQACQQLVGASKFLAKGNPYFASVTDSKGNKLQFAAQIKLGGFEVNQKTCVDTFSGLGFCQTGNPPTIAGGCIYSSDFNLEACLFPGN